MSQLLAFDANILLWIQDNLRNPVLTAILKPLTHLGDKGIIWILITLALLIFKKTRRAGICSMFALIIMVLLNDVLLKHLINRTRPYEVIEGLTSLVGLQSDSSFPSGHTSSSFACWIALTLSLPMVTDRSKTRIYSILMLIFSVLMGFSRLYVGVHYPTDILGGMILGILYGLAGYYLGKFVIRKIEEKKPGLMGEEQGQRLAKK